MTRNITSRLIRRVRRHQNLSRIFRSTASDQFVHSSRSGSEPTTRLTSTMPTNLVMGEKLASSSALRMDYTGETASFPHMITPFKMPQSKPELDGSGANISAEESVVNEVVEASSVNESSSSSDATLNASAVQPAQTKTANSAPNVDAEAIWSAKSSGEFISSEVSHNQEKSTEAIPQVNTSKVPPEIVQPTEAEAASTEAREGEQPGTETVHSIQNVEAEAIWPAKSSGELISSEVSHNQEKSTEAVPQVNTSKVLPEIVQPTEAEAASTEAREGEQSGIDEDDPAWSRLQLIQRAHEQNQFGLTNSVPKTETPAKDIPASEQSNSQPTTPKATRTPESKPNAILSRQEENSDAESEVITPSISGSESPSVESTKQPAQTDHLDNVVSTKTEEVPFIEPSEQAKTETASPDKSLIQNSPNEPTKVEPISESDHESIERSENTQNIDGQQLNLDGSIEQPTGHAKSSELESPQPTANVQPNRVNIPTANRLDGSIAQPTGQTESSELGDPQPTANVQPNRTNIPASSSEPVAQESDNAPNVLPENSTAISSNMNTEDVEDEPLSDVPLQDVWPVQRQLESGMKDSQVDGQSTTAQDEEYADEAVETVLRSIKPAHGTDSSVHIIAPRRPRPKFSPTANLPADSGRGVENTEAPVEQQDDNTLDPHSAIIQAQTDKENQSAKVSSESETPQNLAGSQPSAITETAGQQLDNSLKNGIHQPNDASAVDGSTLLQRQENATQPDISEATTSNLLQADTHTESIGTSPMQQEDSPIQPKVEVFVPTLPIETTSAEMSSTEAKVAEGQDVAEYQYPATEIIEAVPADEMPVNKVQQSITDTKDPKKADVIDTEIGALPSDLWTIIDESVPQESRRNDVAENRLSVGENTIKNQVMKDDKSKQQSRNSTITAPLQRATETNAIDALADSQHSLTEYENITDSHGQKVNRTQDFGAGHTNYKNGNVDKPPVKQSKHLSQSNSFPIIMKNESEEAVSEMADDLDEASPDDLTPNDEQNSGEQEETQADDVEISELARQVYAHLQHRLIVEQERLG